MPSSRGTAQPATENTQLHKHFNLPFNLRSYSPDTAVLLPTTFFHKRSSPIARLHAVICVNTSSMTRRVFQNTIQWPGLSGCRLANTSIAQHGKNVQHSLSLAGLLIIILTQAMERISRLSEADPPDISSNLTKSVSNVCAAKMFCLCRHHFKDVNVSRGHRSTRRSPTRTKSNKIGVNQLCCVYTAFEDVNESFKVKKSICY